MIDFKQKTPTEKKEELDALTRQLQNGIHDYINSQRYTAVLDSMSRFHHYSFNNSIIIGLQKPEATHVASFSKWKSLNRIVNKGEKGIAIFCPVQYKAKKEITKTDENGTPILDKDNNPIKEEKLVEQITFKIGYVFDVSQTTQIEGKKEYPLDFIDDLKFDIQDYELLKNSIKDFSPVPIIEKEIKSNAKGYFSIEKNHIVIRPDLSQAQTIKTMIHEVAHAYLHNKENIIDKNKITFCVAECMEFNTIGEYHENLSLQEAIKIYNRIPSDRLNVGKGIGFELHDNSIYEGGMFPIVQNDQIQLDLINEIEHFRESLLVQKAISDLNPYFSNDGFSLHSTRELQAESVAYCVCKHFGIDTSDYSFGYVGSWMEKPEQLNDNLNAIKSCSSEIIKKLETSIIQTIRNDFNIHSPEEMSNQINIFASKFQETNHVDVSHLFNQHDLVSSISRGDTQMVEANISKVLKSNTSEKLSKKGKDLLKCLKTFQKNPLEDISIFSRERGRKR